MRRLMSVSRAMSLVAVGFFVMLLGLTLSSPSTSAQDPVFEDNLGITAILVIDTYETLPSSAETDKDKFTGKMCVITPTGADGAAWVPTGGGTEVPEISETPFALTSAFYPFEQPHGRMVYTLFESLAHSKNGTEGTITSPVTNQTYPVWSFGSEQILLMEVDTTGYTTDLIASRIVSTVNELYEIGVRRFVFNMSFVLLPCDQFPTFAFTDFIVAVIERGLDTLCDDFLNEMPAYKGTKSTCLGLAINIEERGSRPDSTTRDRNALYSILRNTDFNDARADVYNTVIQPNLQSALDEFYSPSGMLASSFDGDPLKALLTQGTSSQGSLPDGGLYLSVAAAGNTNPSTPPYAPAVFETVLSVSAEYPQAADCGVQLSLTPPANQGQVIDNGFYNCMAGTSFAAPRLSFGMANLLNAVCHGQSDCGSRVASLCLGTPVPSSTYVPLTPQTSLGNWYTTPVGTGIYHPPLSYPVATTGYDLLAVADAANQYCPAFYSLSLLSMN